MHHRQLIQKLYRQDYVIVFYYINSWDKAVVDGKVDQMNATLFHSSWDGTIKLETTWDIQLSLEVISPLGVYVYRGTALHYGVILMEDMPTSEKHAFWATLNWRVNKVRCPVASVIDRLLYVGGGTWGSEPTSSQAGHRL